MLTGWLAATCLAAAVVVSGRPPPANRLMRRETGEVAPMQPTAVVAVAAATLLLTVRGSPVVGVGVIAAALLARRIQRSRQRDHARRAAATATVEVTFALAAELRAGRTPAQSLAAVGPLAGPLRPVLQAAHAAVLVGADPAEELARAAAVPGAERLRSVAAAWTVAAATGGRVATVLERLSEAMDHDDELRRELDAAMAGPRATMVLLAGLPVLGIALGQTLGANPVELLVHRALGWGLLAAAATLDGLGVLLTRTIAVKALRG